MRGGDPMTPGCRGIIDTTGRLFIQSYRRDALRATREGRADEAERCHVRRQAVEAFVRALVGDRKMTRG